MITKLLELLLPYETYSYYFIFCILIACGLGVPIPEDITLVVGGILTSYGITVFWKTALICFLGVLLGDTIVFVAGKYLGNKILKSKFLSKILKARYIAMVKLSSRKYGNYIIFFARFMPGARTPIYFSMGMFKKSFLTFLLIDGFAALISVPIWVYIGMLFGQNLPMLEHYITKMQSGTYIILGIVVILIILFHMLNKKIIALLFKKI